VDAGHKVGRLHRRSITPSIVAIFLVLDTRSPDPRDRRSLRFPMEDERLDETMGRMEGHQREYAHERRGHTPAQTLISQGHA
jgi:hypothetical protein